MHVKISTATEWEGVRREAGSVIEVDEDVYSKNSSWMEPTTAELFDAPAPKTSTTARQGDTA